MPKAEAGSGQGAVASPASALRVPPYATAAPWLRLLSALPDAVTAGGCLVVWISPFAFGADAVKIVVLMMLVEFILVHATGFSLGIVAGGGGPARRVGMLLALSLFYLLFIAAFAAIFHSWWPVTAFAWLLVGKIAWVFTGPRGADEDDTRQTSAWAFSLLAYLGAVFAGLLLPLPDLGLGAAVVPSLHLPGSGAWVEQPKIAVGSAVIYYLLLAAFRLFGGKLRVQPATDAGP